MRYHGTVALDPARVGRDASKVADEVITHLVGLVRIRYDFFRTFDLNIAVGGLYKSLMIPGSPRRMKMWSRGLTWLLDALLAEVVVCSGLRNPRTSLTGKP